MPKLLILKTCHVTVDSGRVSVTLYKDSEVFVGEELADALVRDNKAKIVDEAPSFKDVSHKKGKKHKEDE